MPLKEMFKHFEKMHFNSEEEINQIINNKEYFILLLDNFKIKEKTKNLIHRHTLTLNFNQKGNFTCHIGNMIKHKNCNLIQKENMIKNENKKENIDNPNYINMMQDELTSEERQILSRFYYSCEECDIDFCINCAKLQNLMLKASIHEHPLKLLLRNDGWKCDANKLTQKCQSGFNEYYKADGVPRYKCSKI